MANNYQILSEDAIKYLCGLIRDLASVSEGIDNLHLADDKTFSNIYIKNLIDKCLEDANSEAEKLVGALTHLTCEETAIQPTLDNSEINVIYLYSANGNPPYQQFLKISEDKLVDLGSTSISLEDYIKAADVAKDYATKVELKAVTDKIGTTTLTTTDTTITGAIEEVKGSIEELSSNLGELESALGNKADKNAVLNSLKVVNGNTIAQIIPWNDGTHYRSFKDGNSNTYTDILLKDGVVKLDRIENNIVTKSEEIATMDKVDDINSRITDIVNVTPSTDLSTLPKGIFVIQVANQTFGEVNVLGTCRGVCFNTGIVCHAYVCTSIIDHAYIISYGQNTWHAFKLV